MSTTVRVFHIQPKWPELYQMWAALGRCDLSKASLQKKQTLKEVTVGDYLPTTLPASQQQHVPQRGIWAPHLCVYHPVSRFYASLPQTSILILNL